MCHKTHFNNNKLYIYVFSHIPSASSLALIAFAATLMTSLGQNNYASQQPTNNGAFEFRNAPAQQPFYYNNIYNNGISPQNALPLNAQNSPNSNTGSIYFPTDSMYTPNTNPSQPRQHPSAAQQQQNLMFEYQPQTTVMIENGNFGNNRASAQQPSVHDDHVSANIALPATMPFDGKDYQPVESITEFSWNVFKVSKL